MATLPPDQVPTVEAVVVRAATLPPSPADAAFSIIRIDPQALQDSPRLDEAIKTSPGASLFRRLSSSGSNPTTQGISLRSMAPSGAGRALVTLDGVPQNDPFGGWVIWSSLPTEAMQSVSIVRGAGAGPYGAGALTGVVALDERTSVPGGLAADVSAGGLGERRAAVVGSAQAGPVQFFGDAASEDGARWIPVRERRGAADAPLSLEDWTASGRAQTQIGPATVAAQVGGYRETRDSGLVGAGSVARGTDFSLIAAAQPDAHALGWKLQAWVRQSDLANTSVSVSPDRSTATPADNQYKTPAIGWGLNAAVRKVGDWGSLEAGADMRAAHGDAYEQVTYVNGAFTKGRMAGGDTLVAGLYTEGAWRSGAWLLTGGARIDEWSSSNGHRIERALATGAVTLNLTTADQSGTVPTARVGLRRDIGGGIYLRGAAYAGFRAPSLNELYRPYRVGNNVIDSNEGLKPEKLYGAELALGRDQGALTWAATAFVSQLKDPITNVTLGAGPGTFGRSGFVPAGGLYEQRQNAGEINAVGIEADAQYRLTPTLSARLSGDYTDAKVDGLTVAPQLTGKRPAETPPLTLTGGARWSATARLTVSGEVRYESARFEDDQNTLTLRAATSVAARADFKVNADWTAYIAADNLLDARIETDQTADHVKSYDAPRVVRVGLRFRG
jgi:vitamin B12 transporter